MKPVPVKSAHPVPAAVVVVDIVAAAVMTAVAVANTAVNPALTFRGAEFSNSAPFLLARRRVLCESQGRKLKQRQWNSPLKLKDASWRFWPGQCFAWS